MPLFHFLHGIAIAKNASTVCQLYSHKIMIHKGFLIHKALIIMLPLGEITQKLEKNYGILLNHLINKTFGISCHADTLVVVCVCVCLFCLCDGFSLLFCGH